VTRCEEIRHSLGALVLSALDPVDEQRVREHVAGCADCAAEVAELERTVKVLDLAGPEALVGMEPGPVPHPRVPVEFGTGTAAESELPGPRVLDGLLAAVEAQRRRDRRRRLGVGLAAAAAAAVVAGVGVAAVDNPPAAVPDAAPTTPAPDAQLRGTADQIVLDVGVWERGWGAAVHVSIAGVPGGSTCSLVAVRDDGVREVAATWTVPSAGYDPDAGPLDVDGAVGMQAARVSRFEVVTSAGELLVTAWA
jgi:hypothetical protein